MTSRSLLLLALVGCSKVDRAGEICDDDDDGYVEDVCATQTDYPAGDCDDANADVHPGAVEVCNGFDDNCDGVLEDDEATDRRTWYRDADADGAGDPVDSLLSCAETLAGYAPAGDDCDDADPDVQQYTFYADADDDEHGDPAVTALACAAPDGFVAVADDCDDADRKVNPEEVEVCENGKDDDCDGTSGGCGLNGDLTVENNAAAVMRGAFAGERFGDLGLTAADIDGDGQIDVMGHDAVAWGPLTQDRDAQVLSHIDFGVDPVRNVALWDGELVVSQFYGDHPVRSFRVVDRQLVAGRVSITGRLGQTIAAYGDGIVMTDYRNDRAVYGFADPASVSAETEATFRLTSTSSLYGLIVYAEDLNADGTDDLLVLSIDDGAEVWFEAPSGVVPHEESRDLVATTSEATLFLPWVGDIDDDGRAELFAGFTNLNAFAGEVRRIEVDDAVATIDIDSAFETRYVGPAGAAIGSSFAILRDDGEEARLAVGGSTSNAVGGAVVFVDAARTGVLTGADVVATVGTSAAESLGISMAGLGDIDGDGFADLAIGAGRASYNGADSGAAYVFLGSGL